MGNVEKKNAVIAGVLSSIFDKDSRHFFVQKSAKFKRFGYIQLDKQTIVVIPKIPMGNAVRYAIRQWHKLVRVLDDGRLEMDNNLIENKIRPLACGQEMEDGQLPKALYYAPPLP